MDWSTAAAAVGMVVSVGGLLWGIVSSVFSKKPEDKDQDDRISALEAWKADITASIEKLRQDIEHVKEISDIKDEATNERLKRMENKLDELLDLLISLVKERG